MSTCQARQYSDQMSCGRCGLAWDMNDPAPPACPRAVATLSRKVDIGPALAALKQTSAARAGLVHQANGAPGGRRVERERSPELGKWPDTTERHDIAPPEPRRRMFDGLTAQERRTKSEQWMVDAVARGAVVLTTLPTPGPHMLAFGPWRMPSELPDAALVIMQAAMYEPARECPSTSAIRAAYRELLAYLGQA